MDWASAALSRFLMNHPFQHLSVWITPPKMINEVGPLDPHAVQALGSKVDQLFLRA